MATQIATTTENAAPVTQSAEAERFSLMQRQARMFAMSPLIPEALRKGSPEMAMANCYIAMSIADRMGEDRMTVMQNIHIIHGTAGFKSSYMIARANASGKFSEEIDWEETGSGNDLKVTAFATLAKTGRRVAMDVDMAMAKAEGWTSNKKYTTMPKVMLRYRSAAFLIRLYAPEVMLGHQTADELEDVRYAAAPVAKPLTAAALLGHEANDGTLASDNPHATEGRDDNDRGERTDADEVIGFYQAATSMVEILNADKAARTMGLEDDLTVANARSEAVAAMGDGQ
ncbi:hypothetical protein [Sphingomonas faeni]|uniref:hypothetical protein n=1 Tax=Sphingomonas faeni TaxID=185950 RepID=UPI00334AF598